MPRKYASGLDDSTSTKMVELLNSNLSLVIDLSLTVKQAHWNLKGTGFIGVHELLDTTVAHLRDILDTIAERAVILGGYARGTTQTVVEGTTLEPYPTDITDIEHHLRALTDRYEVVAASLRDAISAAGNAGDEDTADLFTEASRIVDKDAWFIGSNLSGNQPS